MAPRFPENLNIILKANSSSKDFLRESDKTLLLMIVHPIARFLRTKTFIYFTNYTSNFIILNISLSSMFEMRPKIP